MGIFASHETAINQFFMFNLQYVERLRERSTCERLNGIGVKRKKDDFASLVYSLYRPLEIGWSGEVLSSGGWEHTPRTCLSPDEKDPKVLLEHIVAMLAKNGVLKGWANQVPVTTGLLHPADRTPRAIDLVHIDYPRITLVKLASEIDTPMYAAFEILGYGLALLCSRLHAYEIWHFDLPMMRGNRISLWVLGPTSFYRGPSLDWLQRGLNAGLGALDQWVFTDFIHMSFDFRVLPPGFQLPFATGEEVIRACGGGGTGSNGHHPGAVSSIVHAIQNNVPAVWLVWSP